ncbi:3-oxoacyl-ACP reductase [Enterococcus phoeniculicola]|jgi:3-oxoacyl-[acyl-carrier protein] reductase|uniref:3-oxoacyl-ACP reductase n=1 Tax=Enterococcus phoeniculicola ATCC BAA-412 TaxID=1158610 RepID=R3TWF3_9ENTE|nr:3-oxoacyl-ACP reductase [Enterococcus phoeniculicola]EOL45453.1 3-oxoacyl-ACP reductase [Enterococcus phoeniculicola ATCC BAA-412]EOT74815.1 3-oxoacyl-ACP reductase [Enterococcus phoeniculicola ATCC BAA-412]OJG73748.1 3-oxoacyl-ACP reductase [Enterococcus phoeniculicola]
MSKIVYEEFVGKTILATGAGSGIGYAQARAFLEQGAFVYGLDQQSVLMLQLKEDYPATFAFQVGDVKEASVLSLTVAACLERFGKIDILLNTAGILDGYRPLLETSEELWDELMEVDLKSVYRLTKLVLPEMIERGNGTIINMASIASVVAGGGGIAYTTAKHAVAGFTKQLALDYASKGIHVNAIAPGAIQTPMNQADFAGDGAMAKWVENETPVKRWAQPEEVAALTLFLASEQSSYMQGTLVPVDGGWLLK